MSEQQQTEKSIFFVALEMSTVADRAAFLDQACAGNRALRAEVEALFAAHDGTQRLLDIPPIPPRRSCTSGHDGPGSVIGPYKLLDQIGEGGFGVVFMAEQTEPVRRRVALKILRPGMDTRQVVARFEAERQALAMMDHPNIARVFDGGATETGRPYFAMELVKGLPITEYCDRNRLSPRQRLELFMLVCQAVQHAHQKGIIHRDLKPTNVLVTSPDTPVPSHGREGLGGIPKIIDFGIAKALSAELTDKTLFTAFAQIVGTPLYMSPEQAGHNSTVGADIDTRSDIYSLGVLLYELLTGTTPFDKERFKKAAYDEIRNIIREEEPPRPSTRLSELDCAPAARRENGGTSTSTSRLATVAVNRQMEPARLSKLVRGDLDWIVMKAMEKDRNRRYETANGFVMDLQRYLADEPVLACPPSVGYRVRKFVKRSRRALAAIACFFVIVLAAVGAVAGTIGWAVRDRDAREAALAQEAGSAVRDAQRLMEEGHYSEAASALKRADALVPAGGNDLRDRVNELNLDLRMVARLEEIRLPRAVGGAEVSYDDAGGDAAYSQTFREYGIDVDRLSPAEAAAAIGRKVIRIELTVALDCWARRRRNIQSVDEHSWKGLIAVARAADPDEWRNQVRNALESRDSATLAALAASPRLESLPLQTLSLLGEAVQDATTSVAVLHVAQRRYPGDFWINFQLAWSLERLQPPRSIDAIRFYTAAKAVRPRVASIHVFLGNALSRRGDHDEAIAEYRKAVEIQPDYAAAHHNLGVSLHTRNRLDEAVESHRQALRHKPDFALSHLNLAMIANKRGQWDQAILHATRVIELKGDEAQALAHRGHALLGAAVWGMAAVDLGTKSPSGPINDGWTKTACLLLLTGNAHGFRDMCKELSQRLESDQAAGPAYIAARVCSLSHESPIAVSQAVRWAELNVAAGKRQWNLHVLALALYRAGRFDEAIRRSEESLKMRADWNGNMLNWLVLAMAHQRLGRKDEAVQWMEKAANWRDKLPKGRDGNSHCPAALPVQDWLEFQVLLREAQPLVSGKTP